MHFFYRIFFQALNELLILLFAESLQTCASILEDLKSAVQRAKDFHMQVTFVLLFQCALYLHNHYFDLNDLKNVYGYFKIILNDCY